MSHPLQMLHGNNHNSVKVKVGINVLKFVESLIGCEVTVDNDDKKKLLLSYPKNICIV